MLIWYSLDLETATETRGSICEIGVAQHRGDQPTGKKYQSLIKPPKNMYDPGIQTEYTSEDTADAPEWKEVSAEIAGVVGNRPVVAHYANFDYHHLLARNKTENTWLPSGGMFCSLQLARMTEPALPRHTLEALIEHLGIQAEPRPHTALRDAQACGAVFIHYAARHGGIAQTMRKLSRDKWTGSIEWLRQQRSKYQPEQGTPRQLDYIASLVEQAAQDPLWRPALEWLSDMSDSQPIDERWARRLTKHEASTAITLLLQHQPASKKLRQTAHQQLASHPHIEHELCEDKDGWWRLTVAGQGPVILDRPPNEGQETYVFAENAGEKTLHQLLRQLERRPTTV